MDEMIKKYLEIVETYNNAKKLKEDAEDILIGYFSPASEEGTEHHSTEKYKISFVSKLNRTLNAEAYLDVLPTLTDNLKFVEFKPKINLSKLRIAEAIEPKLVSKLVTTTPAKTSIKVKVITGSIKARRTHPVMMAPQASAVIKNPKKARKTTIALLSMGLKRYSASVFIKK